MTQCLILDFHQHINEPDFTKHVTNKNESRSALDLWVISSMDQSSPVTSSQTLGVPIPLVHLAHVPIQQLSSSRTQRRLPTHLDPDALDQPQTQLGHAESAFDHDRHAPGLAHVRNRLHPLVPQLPVNSDVCSGRLFHHTNNTDYPHWARDYLGTTAKP